MNNVGMAESVFAEELAEIECSALRKAVVQYFDTQVPGYFWTAPSSTSGKYHSQFDGGKGGLVRHTQMTVAVCLELLRLAGTDKINKGEVVAALLMHDSVKNGENGTRYRSDHPQLAAEKWMNYAQSVPDISQETAERIFYEILWHSGQWTGPAITRIYQRPKEYTSEIKLVHMSDYIASRNFFNKAIKTEEKKRVMAIEFVENWSDAQYVCNNVALFDERDLSEDAALAIIKANEYDARLVVVTKSQYENVFRSLLNEEE